MFNLKKYFYDLIRDLGEIYMYNYVNTNEIKYLE